VNVVVIGANGQLGSDVVRAFADRGDDVVSLTHADIELSSLESVTASLDERRPDIVVNTAAMHHVENCERDPKKAFAVNAFGARHVAIVTAELRALLIHVSTDYVFDGNKGKPYLENDTPLPLNVYGNSKLAGEYFVRSLNPRHFVLRTSALYGRHSCRAKGGQNFIDLMLKVARERGQVRVVDSEFVSPTSTLDLAQQIVTLSRSDAYDLYHATSEGSCSWYEFAREIFSGAGIAAKLEIASPAEFPTKVARPRYSVLENRGLKTRGLSVFEPWQAGLRKHLRQTDEAYVNLSQMSRRDGWMALHK
jgi:dTDP-4-dehydrorhamnose reductase